MERMNRRNADYGCASDPWTSFSEPKIQSYKQEDVRFWEVSGHNITPNTDHVIDALLIRRNPGQEPSLSQDVIKGFLEQASLAELNDANKTHPDEGLVALLDDRKHDDQGPATGNARTSKGALTARQLYRELEKGRFKKLPVPETDRHEPDAERRLLYITDVDSRAALAIVATASRSHIHYLRDFILRHLSHGAFFGAHINLAHGLKTYALEFHLPFYAVKRSSKPIKDTRRRGNGMPLRESWTHDFQLPQEARHQAGRDGKYCFYESQVSVEVTGCDERSWVGLAFVDTYFREEGNAERVDQFARQAATAIGNGQPMKSCAVADNHETLKVTLDPIALGRLSHKAPIWEPRRYFLRVLGYRFEQVLEEWEDVVQCIWDETSFYSEILVTRNPYFSANAIPDDPDRTNISRRINDSLGRTVNLINKVTNRMSETIEIWGAFKAQNTKHFVGPAIESESEEPSLAMLFDSVDIKFTELEILCQKMMSRKGWLKDLEQQLLADLQHDNIIVAINSQHTNEWAVLLGTITAAILTPLAIVIALFSINDEVLPFPKTPLSFAITLICVAAIIFALAIATWKFSWHRRLLQKLKTANSVWSEDLEMRIPLITASSNACDDRDQDQEQGGNS